MTNKAAAKGEVVVLTENCPTWLEVVDEKYVRKPEMVETVQKMFEMAAQGFGNDNIFRSLNGRLATKNGHLSLSWISRTLRNRTVLGEFQHGDDEPILLYPKIIDQSEFDAAALAIDKRIRNDGKVFAHGGRSNSERVDNLFTSLVHDVTEGDARAMHFQKVARGSYFRTEKSGDERKPNSINYSRFETAMLSFFEDAEWKKIAGQTESDELKKATSDLEAVLGKIDRLSRNIATKSLAMDADDIDLATVKVLASQVAKDEAVLASLTAQKDALQAGVDAERGKCEAIYTPERLLELVKSDSPEYFDVCLRLKAEIAKRVERIDIDFKEMVATVTLVNGYTDVIVFQS